MAICVEFCLKHSHFSCKWLGPILIVDQDMLGSILIVDQEVCLEYFLKSIILKDSIKTQLWLREARISRLAWVTFICGEDRALLLLIRLKLQ